MNNITRAGVDIAKSVFHVHAVDRHDQTLWQIKLRRGQWLDALCDRLGVVGFFPRSGTKPAGSLAPPTFQKGGTFSLENQFYGFC